MLITYGQFELRQAVRSSAHLLQPRTVLQANMKMPQGSLIHYLTLKDDNKFPARDMVYLAGVPDNKRVPIFHVKDLITKTEVMMLEDRYLDKNIRNWQRDHMQAFRPWELLEVPNPDRLTNGVINYNLLKGLYKYKSTMTAPYNRYMDLMRTYWTTIGEAIAKDPKVSHFATIAIPNAIPSRMILNKIVEFSPARYARVVTSHELNGIIQLYKYLDPATRSDSAMVNLPETAAEHLTVELTYGGYSVFCKLSYLISLHKDSTLPNKTKFATDRLHQVFLLMLLKIQKIVEEKRQGTNPELLLEDEQDAAIDPNNIEAQIAQDPLDDVDDNQIVQPDPLQEAELARIEQNLVQGAVQKTQTAIHTTPIKLTKLDDNLVFDDQSSGSVSWDKMLDNDLAEFEGASDDLFAGAVKRAMQTPEIVEQDETDPEVEASVNDIHAVDYSEENISQILREPTLEEKFNTYIEQAKGFDAISTAEARTLRKTFEARKSLKSPYAEVPIDQFKVVTPEDLAMPDTSIPITNNLIADHLKQEKMFSTDRKYIQQVLRKHLTACVTSLEKNDLIIKDYQVEEVRQSTGRYEIHKLVLKPLKGKESPVYFRIPVINDEGEYTAGGVTYRMRGQKSQVPIYKMSPIKVGITSNYNKLFVQRTERKAYDPYSNIADQIKTNYLDGKGNITKIAPANRFDNLQRFPNIYAAMSQNFNDVTTPNYRFFFNYREMGKHIEEKVIKELQAKDLLFVGHDQNKHILVMDKDENIYDYSDGMKELPALEALLELDVDKIPQAFSTVKILGDAIPLGVILSYYMGLKNLVAVTRSKMQVLPPNTRNAEVTKNGVSLKFADARVIIECPNQNATLLFAGFKFYANFIKTQSLESFYSQNVYLDLLEFRDGGLMHLRELDTLRNNFLDPITIQALEENNEPTEFLPLLLRANQLLEDFHHSDINSSAISRIRGYDRVPGLVYRALTESIRAHQMKGGKGKIELDPYKVWKYVTQDTTVKVVEDNNPITDVKEVETVTFSGLDGLSRTATPEKLRKYHQDDAGLISEATVDSTDVALIAYKSPYAKIKSLLGTVDTESTLHEEHPDTIFSTSLQLTPMGEYDDPKRQNFVNIQNGHTIAASGYHQPALRTGHEYLMPYKVGKLYCIMAEEDGKITEITDKLLKVVYKSGKQQSYRIGQTYGRMEGSVYKHEIVTSRKAGMSFKRGDWLAYNNGFFEPDWLDSSRLIMKFSKLVTVALARVDEVYEDSSAISAELSRAMSSVHIEEKKFIIEFGKHILDLHPEGHMVTPTDLLFTLVDENTDYSNLSQSSIDLLKSVANTSPKAKVDGKIFRYEIKYNGDLSDMSPSLKKLAQRLDRQLFEETQGTDKEAKNNAVHGDYLSDGKTLMPGTLELKIFIEAQSNTVVADKGVFSAQMKSVVSKILTSKITTVSGKRVDALFSYSSMLGRGVLSPILAGSTNRLLVHLSPTVADTYFN